MVEHNILAALTNVSSFPSRNVFVAFDSDMVVFDEFLFNVFEELIVCLTTIKALKTVVQINRLI